MTRPARWMVAALGLLLASTAAFAAEPVDLLLVLSADISRSIDQPKFQLQRDGYASAISDPRVMQAIQSGQHRRIAICFVEWSGASAQKVVIDWTLISDEASARNFSGQVVEAPRAFAERTSISAGIDFAFAQFERAPFSAPRRVIDISGDGTNNSGRDASLARDEVVAKGVTINGLVILTERPMQWNPEHTNPPGGLKKYYEDNVTGGPGSFVLEAQNFESFGKAILNKLIAEIADLPPPHQAASLGRIGFAAD